MSYRIFKIFCGAAPPSCDLTSRARSVAEPARLGADHVVPSTVRSGGPAPWPLTVETSVRYGTGARPSGRDRVPDVAVSRRYAAAGVLDGPGGEPLSPLGAQVGLSAPETPAMMQPG